MLKITFLTQEMREPMRRGVLLEFVLPLKNGPVGDVKIRGSLEHGGCEMMNFRKIESNE